MTHLLLSTLVGLALHGSVTYYSPGVMEVTYANRLAWGHVEPCANCVGKIAVLDCKKLGQHAYMTIKGRIIGPLLVADCAAAQDYRRLLKRGLIAEFEFKLARKFGMVGVGPLYDVEMFLMEPN